jgi:hypothetical protein
MDAAGSDEGRKGQRLLESASDDSSAAPATNLSSGLSKLCSSEAAEELRANILSTIPKTPAQQDGGVSKQAATIETLNSFARSAHDLVRISCDLAHSNSEKEREGEGAEEKEREGE